MKNKKALLVTTAAVIAALYVVLNYLSEIFGLSFGAVQLRLAEVLTVLPVFTPAAIPGLAIGCAIANIASPFGVADVFCGAFATLASGIATFCLRKIEFGKIPFLSFLPPVLINGIVIGAEISLINAGGFQMFALTFLQIALGQAIVCIVLGIPFFRAVKKTKIFNKSGF